MNNPYTELIDEFDAFSDQSDDLIFEEAHKVGMNPDAEGFDEWYEEQFKLFLTAYMGSILPNLHMVITFKPRNVEENEEQTINMLWIPRT
jgi:hypothetical protein